MEITPDLLESYLRVCKAAGVREFTLGDLKVLLGPPMEPTPERSRPAVKDNRSLYENPVLWPGGTPPKFHNE